MLTGLILASVLGALAVPDFVRLADAMGLGEDGDDQVDAEGDARTVEGGSDPLTEATLEASDVADDPSAAVDVAPQDPGDGLEDDLVLMPIDAVPGVIQIDEFDPEAQEIVLNVPENTTGYLTSPADPDADPPVPAMLTFEVPDGAVEVHFTEMDTVPVGSISLSAAGSDATGIESLLLDDDPGLAPDDPETPADGGIPAEPAESAIMPDDPEEPGVSGAQEIIGPEPALLPDDPDPAVSLGSGPQQIVGFDPQTDILQIGGPEGADVEVLPSIDAADAEVFVDDALVAIVVGVPGLTLDGVQLVPGPV